MSNEYGAATILALVITSCGSPPAVHHVRRADSVHADFETTWSALIDLFGERDWAISHIDKASGFIVTDWLSVGGELEADRYADCGNPGLRSVRATQVRFNVRVKAGDEETEVVVNTSFRQLDEFDGHSRTVDCTSRGIVEDTIHREIDARTRDARPRRRLDRHHDDGEEPAATDSGSGSSSE